MEEPRVFDDVAREESEGSKHGSSSSEDSDWEDESDSEDRAFYVDEELDDSDADDDIQSRNIKVGNDDFLYDVCEVPVNKETVDENVDNEVIREDGLSLDEGGMEIQMDGEPEENGPKIATHDPTVPWKQMKPHLGERFPNKEQLRMCLANYAVANGFPIKVTKSASDYLQAKCGTYKKGNKCPFKLWVAWMNKEQSFQIKALDENHTCIREYRHATLVNPNWIATHYLKKLSSNLKLKGREIKADIKRKYLCEVSKEQCYRAKKLALDIINGKLVEHYARIWDYAHEITRSNPGSTAKVGVTVNPDGKTYFHRFYVCFKAVKDGWSRSCRRVIGLDGCFLKGQSKGELLTAIGRDGNNQVYPIAWAVVDVENRANWEWFMELLVDDLGLQVGGGLTIISDQHKGLVEAAKNILPVAEHRQCARHVYANFKKVYNGVDYKRLFWAAATSSHKAGHYEAMQELRCINKGAYEYLQQRQPQSWSRAFFPEDRACEAVENGISESFNSIIVEARTKPLLTMLEEIRMYVMDRFCRMATKHLTWTEEVCPSILKKLSKWTEDISITISFPKEENSNRRINNGGRNNDNSRFGAIKGRQLDLPTFDGNDSDSWIMRAERETLFGGSNGSTDVTLSKNRTIEDVNAQTLPVDPEIVTVKRASPFSLPQSLRGYVLVMMSNSLRHKPPGEYKRRFVTCIEEDRISDLPEHLMDSILERVPLQDAVRTSIISKKWRYRWTTMKQMVFDQQFFETFEKNGAFGCNEFIKIMNQVLILYKGPISTFHLHIPNMNLYNFHEVDEWMLFLSRISVKELIISNKNEQYELPSHVFSCLELEKLQLLNCFWKPPLEFKGFLNLEDLIFFRVDFGANLHGTTEISLPQLKRLYIGKCTNVNKFNIKATKLQKLDVFSCPDAMFSQLLDSPCLMELVLFYQSSVQVEKMNFATLLSKFRRIERLCISGDLFKCFIAETIPKWLPNSFNSLKRLCLVSFEVGDSDELHGVLCLLRNSPNLETLVLFMWHVKELEVVDNEVEAINDLEAPNCLDSTLNELKSVEITILKGLKLELLFIKILLAHSPSLNKFTIKPIGISDAQRRVEIGNEVMQFSRASPKAELIYLNPES